MPDAAPGNPHGMAVKFHLPGGADTDIVAVSLKNFPIASVADFRDLLLAVAASPPGTPSPTPIETFLKSHPAAMRALVPPPPVPVSFATESYYGFNAFRLVAADGTVRNVRYRIVPVAGEQYFDPEAAKAAPPNVLVDELKRRLAAGPARFRLLAQVAAADDPTNDSTVNWPDTRPVIELGEIDVSAVVPNSAEAEKALLFLPGQLTDGIEASDDPLIDGRDAAYAVSFSRRSQ
jgi:catalase